MPAQFIVENGTVSIRLEWVGVPIAKAQEIVGYAALYDWKRGLGPTIIDPELGEIQKPWGDLTNQEKLDMVYAAAQRLIVAQAKTAYINEQQNAAKDTASEYAESEFILDSATTENLPRSVGSSRGKRDGGGGDRASE